jgi:hypothetical protein
MRGEYSTGDEDRSGAVCSGDRRRELVKICTLALVYGKLVIPHGHSVPAVHGIAATPPTTCPMAEFLIRSQPAA